MSWYFTLLLTVVRRVGKPKSISLDTYMPSTLTSCISWRGSDAITKFSVRPSITTNFNRWRHHPGSWGGRIVHWTQIKSSYIHLSSQAASGFKISAAEKLHAAPPKIFLHIDHKTWFKRLSRNILRSWRINGLLLGPWPSAENRNSPKYLQPRSL